MRITAFAILAVFALATACSSEDGLECDPVYQASPSGKSCVPILSDAKQPEDTGSPIEDVPDVQELPDIPTVDVVDAAFVDDSDAAPVYDIPTPTGAIGDRCQSPNDCQSGMICLGWPHGYCSVKDCDTETDDCPEGSRCLALYGDSTACFAACEEQNDCRWWYGEYACKTLPGAPEPPRYPDGRPTRVCVGLDDEPHGNGESCVNHSSCESELSCVQSLPGGNCLQLFCEGPMDCEAQGSACVAWNGQATCMQTCGGDPDCSEAGNGTLVCTELETLGQNDVDVCASSTSGLPLGRGCLSDFECDSGECQLLGTGHCQLGEPSLPCFTQDDCPAGTGTCQPASPPVSSCTTNCELVGVCPGGGGCVRENSDEDAMCRPACEWSQSHAYHNCLELSGGMETGWDCVYGIPHRTEDLDGFYCATIRPGQVGSTCDDTTDCNYESPICWQWPDADDDMPGYCSRSCGPQNPCPFGTYCFETSSGPRCLKLCASALDCAEGYRCGATSDIPQTTSGKDICLP